MGATSRWRSYRTYRRRRGYCTNLSGPSDESDTFVLLRGMGGQGRRFKGNNVLPGPTRRTSSCRNYGFKCTGPKCALRDDLTAKSFVDGYMLGAHRSINASASGV